MSDSYIKAAFEKVCAKAERPQGVWLSLYSRQPFYGGPEEGGWWGEDVVLEATQQFDFEDDAQAAREMIDELAAQYTEEARTAYGRQCNDEIEWCEARGIDHETFLREPDGATTYFVVIEKQRGERAYDGCRHYE